MLSPLEVAPACDVLPPCELVVPALAELPPALVVPLPAFPVIDGAAGLGGLEQAAPAKASKPK
ncbi:MAG TPA: hypothetical protein VGM44_00195 [Polyangiaceae bacterium]|jgi:hypothetical protein